MAVPRKKPVKKKRIPRLSREELGEDISFVKLNKDLRDAAKMLTKEQARFLVDIYYQVQQFRINAGGQVRAAIEDKEPHRVSSWVYTMQYMMEDSIKSSLQIYSEQYEAGRWAKSQMGIGPVIASGLLAHINPKLARTTSGVWRFAGQDPSAEWKKGQKRPWNASLKVLCWKIGESFVKVYRKPTAYYGAVYIERKQQEIDRNSRKEFAQQAREILEKKRFRNDTIAKAAYLMGTLPDGHIHARAKRFAVKLFLAHYFQVAWESRYLESVPKPYVIGILGHAKYLQAPGWSLQEYIARLASDPTWTAHGHKLQAEREDADEERKRQERMERRKKKQATGGDEADSDAESEETDQELGMD